MLENNVINEISLWGSKEKRKMYYQTIRQLEISMQCGTKLSYHPLFWNNKWPNKEICFQMCSLSEVHYVINHNKDFANNLNWLSWTTHVYGQILTKKLQIKYPLRLKKRE